MLASELDNIRLTSGLQMRARNVEGWDQAVKQLLLDMGLFELLKVKNKPISTPHEGIRYIKFRSHHKVLGEMAHDLQNDIQALIGQFLNRKVLARGLAEAMTNVHQHAYPDEYEFGQPMARRWWMGASVDASERRLTVTVFDQGVGIPYTLPRSGRKGLVQRTLALLGLADDDAARIRAAMEIGQSSTKMANRGHGLRDIKRFAELHQQAELRILSGHGEYIYTTGSDERLVRHTVPTKGTMVYWSATLS